MDSNLPNLLMISGDASIAAGHRGAFYHLLERFSRAWDRVDVILPRPSALIGTRLFDNVFLHPAAVSRALQWRHILDQGKRLHGQRSYALMTSHDYGWHYNGLGAWLLHRCTGTPYVSEIHHVTGYPRAADLKEWLQGQFTRMYIRAVRDTVCAFRVVNAIELPELLTQLGVSPSKILVLYSLYIDHAVFKPVDVVKRYDVMFCGRLESNKGTDILFRALALLAEQCPDIALLVRGNGSEERHLKRLAARLGIESRLFWRPWVQSLEELAELYNESRILVCTSLSEGGPRVTVEAMACGTPVVTTAVGIMREIVTHGVTGLLTDWTPRSVASAIENLLTNTGLRTSIGEAGRQAVQRFQRAAVIEAYASAYRQLAARAGAPLPL